MRRTDTRGLAERKASVMLRVSELRKALGEAERCQAEIEIAIEEESRRREEARGHAAAE